MVLQDVVIGVNQVKCAEDLSVLFLTTAYESQKVFNLKKKKRRSLLYPLEEEMATYSSILA